MCCVLCYLYLSERAARAARRVAFVHVTRGRRGTPASPNPRCLRPWCASPAGASPRMCARAGGGPDDVRKGLRKVFSAAARTLTSILPASDVTSTTGAALHASRHLQGRTVTSEPPSRAAALKAASSAPPPALLHFLPWQTAISTCDWWPARTDLESRPTSGTETGTGGGGVHWTGPPARPGMPASGSGVRGRSLGPSPFMSRGWGWAGRGRKRSIPGHRSCFTRV